MCICLLSFMGVGNEMHRIRGINQICFLSLISTKYAFQYVTVMAMIICSMPYEFLFITYTNEEGLHLQSQYRKILHSFGVIVKNIRIFLAFPKTCSINIKYNLYETNTYHINSIATHINHLQSLEISSSHVYYHIQLKNFLLYTFHLKIHPLCAKGNMENIKFFDYTKYSHIYFPYMFIFQASNVSETI